MKRFVRLSLFAAMMLFLSGCMMVSESAALSKKDLSKVVLQEAEVPEEFRNMSIFNQQDAEMFFQRGEEDVITAYAGASYLNPQGGLNYIYSVVVVYDDETSAADVYYNVIDQVNAKMHLESDKIGDESLLYTIPSGTSFYNIWHYKEAVGYVAIITKLKTSFDRNDVIAASKLMQSRLEE
jgi:hypothetical protein